MMSQIMRRRLNMQEVYIISVESSRKSSTTIFLYVFAHTRDCLNFDILVGLSTVKHEDTR